MAINEVSTKPNLQQTQKSEAVSTTPVKADDSISPLALQRELLVRKQVEQQESEESQPLQTDRQELDSKVAQLNDYMQNLHRSLQFQVDEQSGETVIKVIDSETDEMVRQIPSQEVLDAKNAVDKYKGILLEAKV
jgi:flagellar protein FlaG